MKKLIVKLSCAMLSMIVLFTLSACQSLPLKADSCRQFGDIPGSDFQYSGKMALSDGTEGGSGRFSWEQNEAYVTALFKAPMGQGSWLLTETATGASILVNNKNTYYDKQAEPLISDIVGWPIPWQALKSWVSGVAYKDTKAEVQLSQNGKTIYEQGWQINYSQYHRFKPGCLPQKITAQKDNYRIKLIISDWQ